jgi:DNA primase
MVNLLAEIFGFPRRFDHGNVEVEYNCPHCDKSRGKFNMVVNTDDHVFHCWACGYKGKVDRLFYDFGSDSQRSEWFTIDKPLATHKDPEVKEELLLTGFRSLRIEWKDSLTYRAAMKYLRDRKIGPDLIQKWDICYAESGKYQDRIIVPSRNVNGKMEYFVARDIFDTQKFKYRNPPSEKATVIFGEKFIDWGKPVLLTEGVFDAMVLYNAVPLLGSSIEGHNRLITKIFDCHTPIILGFDEDAAGRKANRTIGKYLLNLGVQVYTIQGNKHKDLSKAYELAGKEYIVKLIRSAKPYDELDLAIAPLLQGTK